MTAMQLAVLIGTLQRELHALSQNVAALARRIDNLEEMNKA